MLTTPEIKGDNDWKTKQSLSILENRIDFGERFGNGKLRLDVENNIKERRQCPKYYEFANEEKVDRQATETASKLEESLRLHQDEQLRMKLDMLDRELELEAETKKIQIARKAATESNNKTARHGQSREESFGKLYRSLRGLVGKRKSNKSAGHEKPSKVKL
ncbi:hypothetical protein CEXT_773541 [Caerostris extrusa]|uniref:Uncharacterized protein n=1 Tax=Caerostris extrusa TaxID=172846 RepID=A0AAV4N3Q3_CAEEX|nr:hypothetical protein CEXT_773541 [Caerostris extrusa]